MTIVFFNDNLTKTNEKRLKTKPPLKHRKSHNIICANQTRQIAKHIQLVIYTKARNTQQRYILSMNKKKEK